MFTEKYVGTDSIYYVQYNRCWSKELEKEINGKKNAKGLPSFSEFEKKILKTIKEKPLKKLIFDMRFNSGGSSSQGTNLINKLSKLEKINKKGKLYVVVGRKTFSSAILNTMDFINKTEAIIIGEETGGMPNHFGETRFLKLPTSGLKVCYSTKYFEKTKKGIKTITPDVKIEISFDDFLKGIDPVYEWIKFQH